MTTRYGGLLKKSWPVGLLLIAMTSIQSGASLAHTLFDLAGPAGVTSVRLILATLFLLAVFRPWRKPIAPGAWPAIVIYGVALGCMNFLFYQALARIPLGIAVAFEFTGPLSVAILSSRRRLDLLWVAIAVAGLVALLWPAPGVARTLDPVGVLFALGAGAAWAFYIVFGQKAGTINGTQSAVLGVAIAALVAAPIGVWHAGTAILRPTVLVLGAGVALFSTALPYTLEMIAMPRLATSTFGTLMSLEPAFGALSGLVFLNQALSATQWVAILAVMAASIGTTLTTHDSASADVHDVPPPD